MARRLLACASIHSLRLLLIPAFGLVIAVNNDHHNYSGGVMQWLVTGL